MNWGNKLLAAFVVFIAMMGYMAFRCFGTNFELVEKDYYKSELRYQEVIDGAANANALSAAPVVQQSGNAVILRMPDEMKNTAVTGHILFYCSYDSKKDKKVLLSLDGNGQQSFTSVVAPGVYTVKIGWIKDGKKYYAEKNITVL